MKKTQPFMFFRRANSSDYLLNFYVASIVAILLSRFLITVCGECQLGAGTLHIAHVLWGGFFMAVSLFLQFYFLGRAPMQITSILGGVGFGIFLDEIGKFITKDNNYFYKPAVVIIYMIYLGLFFATRALHRTTPLTMEERKMNMALLHGDAPSESVLMKLQRVFRKKYRELMRKKQFQRVAQGILLSYAGLVFFNLIRIIFLRHTVIDVHSVIQLVLNGTAAGFIFAGYAQKRRSLEQTYAWYERATLIWIFGTQAILFYQDQFSAVFYLAGALLLFGAVRILREEERLLRSRRELFPS